jgi:hypothetical protein
VVASTLANIDLEGEQLIETVSVVDGDRVLVTAQTDPVENGIYDASTSAWKRSADFDGNRDITRGTMVNVTVPGPITSYVQTLTEPVIGVDPILFTLFFTQLAGLDDLADVDLTGCADDDMMHFVGGVLVCTLGALTYDGDELLNDGNIGIKGFNNGGATLRARESADLVSTVNPRRNDQFTGIGGTFGNLAFMHDDNATASFPGLHLKKITDLRSQRIWNVEGRSASTTQTQGESPLRATLCRITAVLNANDVVTLFDAPELGLDQIVMNLGANVLQLFPASGDDLGLGTDVSMTIQPGGAAWFIGIDADTWHLISVGTGAGGGGGGGVFRGAKAYQTGVASWPLNNTPTFSAGGPPGLSETPVLFNTNVFDTDSIHSTSVNTTRFTTPVGVSRITLRAGYTINGDTSGGYRHMRFRLNGGLSLDPNQGNFVSHTENNAPGSGSWWGGIAKSGVVTVANPGTDYYEVYVLRQNSSGFTIANTVWMEMEIIS